MKRTIAFAVSLFLVAMAACSGSSHTNTPSTTQPTPTNSPCTFSISPSTANFATGGGSQVVNVTAAPPGCAPSAWTASAANAALSLTPASGSGNGSVTVTASPNTTTAQQTLTATIAGDTFSATIAAVGCSYTFSANKPDQNGNTWIVPSDGSQQGVTVTVTPNDGSCAPWKAASSADWITVSPSSGTTSTTVAINYSANNAAGARSGNVSFLRPGCSGSDCGLIVELNQSPAPPPLEISANCGGPYHAGDYAFCALFVLGTGQAVADLRMFGGPAEVAPPRCPACGEPPTTYDLYFQVPTDMTPGAKTFPIWAVDARGRRTNATASIEIVSR